MTAYIGKHIEDLDDDQVLALTYDDVEQLVKLRMAEDGIPILPMPIEPEYVPVAGADQTVYEVAGLGFRDRDAAEAVLAVINQNAASRVKGTYDYTSTGDYSTRFVEVDDSEQSVTTRMYYSQESYAASKDALAENARKKADYEAERREFDKAERDAEGIREAIHDRIAEVGSKRRRGEFLAERFREYLGIAAGDVLMAMQFLVKAYSLSDEEIAELRRVEEQAGHTEINQVPVPAEAVER